MMKTTKALGAVLLFTLAAIQHVEATTNYVLEVRSSADYVRIPDHASLDFTTNLTIEAWIKPSQISSQIGTVVSKRRSLNGDGYNLSVVREEALFGMNDDPGDNLPIHNFGVGTPNLIKAGQWQHLAGTYDGRTARIYVNGKLGGSAATTRKLLNSSQPLLIGQSGLPGDPRPFIGQIDEVRLWDTALTVQQIQTNMWRVLNGRESNLVGYWSFNTGSAGDLGPFGNLGQLMGQAKIVAGFQEFVKVQPVLTASGYSRLLGFRFRLAGEANATYQVDSSTDMLQWTPFVRLTQPSEPIVFTDTTATNFVNFRFYRAARVP